MPLFTSQDLDDFSSLFQDLAFTDVCEIQEQGGAMDVEGGSPKGYHTIATSTCFVAEGSGHQSGTERAIAEKMVGKVTKRIFFARGTVVNDNHQLLIGGVKYHVIAVSKETTLEVTRVAYVYQESAT